jgi:hypothetical protein
MTAGLKRPTRGENGLQQAENRPREAKTGLKRVRGGGNERSQGTDGNVKVSLSEGHGENEQRMVENG